MDSPSVQAQPFEALYRNLGVSHLVDVNNDHSFRGQDEDEEAPLTRIVTRGPQGSIVEISSGRCRSRGSSVTRAFRRALAGVRSVFRSRSRSSTGDGPLKSCSQGTHLACAACHPATADLVLNEQLREWTWPPRDQPPREEVLYRELDPLDTTYSRTSDDERRTFLENGLDYVPVERPQRMVSL